MDQFVEPFPSAEWTEKEIRGSLSLETLGQAGSHPGLWHVPAWHGFGSLHGRAVRRSSGLFATKTEPFSSTDVENSSYLARRLAFAYHEKVYEELADSERYQLATKGALGGLWDWDVTSNRIHFTSRWCSLLGINRSAFDGRLKDWLDRVHRKTWQAWKRRRMPPDGKTEELRIETSAPS